MTTVVHMQYTWLTDPVTDVSVAAASPTRAGKVTLSGNYLTGAGGRVRVISGVGDDRSFPLVLQSLSDDDLLLLEAWRGKPILLRDGMGWRTWGSFLDLQWNDVPGGDGMVHDVTLTVQAITYDEAV